MVFIYVTSWRRNWDTECKMLSMGGWDCALDFFFGVSIHIRSVIGRDKSVNAGAMSFCIFFQDGSRKPIQVTEKIPNLIYMTSFVAPYPAVTRRFLSMSFRVCQICHYPLSAPSLLSSAPSVPSISPANPYSNTLEIVQNPSQDTCTEANGWNSNFGSGSEDFAALRVGVVSLMTRDSSGGWHVAFVRVSRCAVIYDGTRVNIAILSSSGGGEYQHKSQKPGGWGRQLHDDGRGNFVGNILSRIFSRCRKALVGCVSDLLTEFVFDAGRWCVQ